MFSRSEITRSAAAVVLASVIEGTQANTNASVAIGNSTRSCGPDPTQRRCHAVSYMTRAEYQPERMRLVELRH
jgi:hypothetical protein